MDSCCGVAGKTALVTGASSGIGRVFSLCLAKKGANVIVAARRKEKLQHLVDEITSQKGKAEMLEMDVCGSEASLDAAIEKAWGFFGGIDILVNNAGVSDKDGNATFEKGEEVWNRVLEANLRGPGLIIKAVATRLIAQGKGGAIINVASCVGMHRGHSFGNGVYAMSKAALIHLSESLALELGPHGIRVNSIAPGLFHSEMTHEFWEKAQGNAKNTVPLKRLGEVEKDLTSPLLLLASDSGSYITGTTIVVDGGWSLNMKPFVT